MEVKKDFSVVMKYGTNLPPYKKPCLRGNEKPIGKVERDRKKGSVFVQTQIKVV